MQDCPGIREVKYPVKSLVESLSACERLGGQPRMAQVTCPDLSLPLVDVDWLPQTAHFPRVCQWELILPSFIYQASFRCLRSIA